eukprot:8447374-Pyramimonas_sp.AAC.1
MPVSSGTSPCNWPCRRSVPIVIWQRYISTSIANAGKPADLAVANTYRHEMDGNAAVKPKRITAASSPPKQEVPA